MKGGIILIHLIENKEQKAALCREVLRGLPDWFGIPEAIEEYAEACRELPLWADLDGERPRGFLAYRQTGPSAGEVYVMGVARSCHRQGVGQSLFRALHAYAKEAGCRFLTVKTVEMGRYAAYDGTNLFYRSLGFTELECFPDLWGPANPCQVYIMLVE